MLQPASGIRSLVAGPDGSALQKLNGELWGGSRGGQGWEKLTEPRAAGEAAGLGVAKDLQTAICGEMAVASGVPAPLHVRGSIWLKSNGVSACVHFHPDLKCFSGALEAKLRPSRTPNTSTVDGFCFLLDRWNSPRQSEDADRGCPEIKKEMSGKMQNKMNNQTNVLPSSWLSNNSQAIAYPRHSKEEPFKTL